jgi:hypothetical protein
LNTKVTKVSKEVNCHPIRPAVVPIRIVADAFPNSLIHSDISDALPPLYPSSPSCSILPSQVASSQHVYDMTAPLKTAYGGGVLGQVKAIILVLLVGAIVFVLISPLPELAATKSSQALLEFAQLLLVLMPALAVISCALLCGSGAEPESRHDVRAVLCTRLC